MNLVVLSIWFSIHFNFNFDFQSYGEASCVHNYGRFVDLATDLVEKDGVIFVSSAGK